MNGRWVGRGLGRKERGLSILLKPLKLLNYGRVDLK
jgi:hypothetical protein